MLWRKEKVRGKMVYVDLLNHGVSEFYGAMNRLFTEMTMAPQENLTKKDQQIANDSFQTFLNRKLSRVNSDSVFQSINMAICHATGSGDMIARYYEFRAKYFYELEQFNLCLADIELARAHSSPNAERSGAEAAKPVEKKKSVDLEEGAMAVEAMNPVAGPQLSFPADEKIPCFARGLKVKQSKMFGKHVVTTRNFQIGQTVIVEDAYCMRSNNDQNYLQCANCFARTVNLIPCKKCAAVMFCSQNCYDVGHVKFHEIECGVRGMHTTWEAARRIVMQTVINAIKLFPNIDDLMETIGKFFERKSNEGVVYTDPLVREYMQFFGLGQSMAHTRVEQDQVFIDYTRMIGGLIVNHPQHKTKFRTLEAKRFLGHLIVHHFYIVDANSFDARDHKHGAFTTGLGLDDEFRSGFTYWHAIHLNGSLLNHSCQPNIARLFMGTKLVGKVLRPIKAGEQLFITYLNPINLFSRPKIYRTERLATIHHFRCSCDSCYSDLPSFTSSAKPSKDEAVRKMLDLFRNERRQHKLSITKGDLLTFEESAIKYLRQNNNVHPTKETLIIQFVLSQIWNNLGR